MIVAGGMSGTSADGIDVALVEIGAPKEKSKSAGREPALSLSQGRPPHTKFQLLGHAAFPYPARVRQAVLEAMNSQSASVADLARLNFLLGDLYAKAVLAAQRKFRVKAGLVGCHGQTVYHQGEAAAFLGKRLAVTWQMCEASCIAQRVGVPVISDFRPADLAAGGKGAPLVPYLDYLLYRDPSIGRIALNIGGIANVTAVPANAARDDLVAFDTGPGNMVIDALTEQLFGKRYDRDGRIAARGREIDDVVAELLRDPFFRKKPPKTAGREEFGREFAKELHERCRKSRVSQKARAAASTDIHSEDIVATATALTSRSIADAIKRHLVRHGKFSELIVSGGGTKNRTLMNWLSKDVRALGLSVRSSDEFGIPSEAKEALAFAVLAFETWNRRPSNVPSATGARRPAVLGKISYP